MQTNVHEEKEKEKEEIKWKAKQGSKKVKQKRN